MNLKHVLDELQIFHGLRCLNYYSSLIREYFLLFDRQFNPLLREITNIFMKKYLISID